MNLEVAGQSQHHIGAAIEMITRSDSPAYWKLLLDEIPQFSLGTNFYSMKHLDECKAYSETFGRVFNNLLIKFQRGACYSKILEVTLVTLVTLVTSE